MVGAGPEQDGPSRSAMTLSIPTLKVERYFNNKMKHDDM
jgi:hypothetical protein